jgi:hypothetical protein
MEHAKVTEDKTEVYVSDTTYTFNAEGKLHSFGDKPSIKPNSGHVNQRQEFRFNGNIYHHNNGTIHRDTGPAVYDAPYTREKHGSYAFVKNGVADDPEYNVPAMYNEQSNISVYCHVKDATIKLHNYGIRFYGSDDYYKRFADSKGIPRNPCTDVKKFMELQLPKPTISELLILRSVEKI